MKRGLFFPPERIGGTGIRVQHPAHLIESYPVVLRGDGGDTVRGYCQLEVSHVRVTGSVHHAAIAGDSREDQAMRSHKLQQNLQRGRKEA